MTEQQILGLYLVGIVVIGCVVVSPTFWLLSGYLRTREERTGRWLKNWLLYAVLPTTVLIIILRMFDVI